MPVANRKPSLLSRILRRAIYGIYKRNGWTATGTVPEPRKFVLVAAPHTSNWDFIYFIGLTEDLGIMPHFMAKDSLFKWPVRNFLFDMGGVSIDRKSPQNYVQQMADEFAKRDEFMLTIAPEGSRSNSTKWKTGFYQIALAAKVPFVIGMMDYEKKTGGLGPAIYPTGDYEADMAKVIEFYRNIVPRHPERAVKSITGKEGL
ncbi:MAG: acyltransferase [Sphingomonadales bacterium]|nr:acyltransferase [Sphingomonadales bacterium]